MPAHLSSDPLHSLEYLHDVFEKCALTLRSAGELIDDHELRKRVLEHERFWRRIETELDGAMRDNDVPPNAGFGIMAPLRRTWMKVKYAVGDTRAIIVECKYREGEARERLETVLLMELPADMRFRLTEILRETEELTDIA